MQAQQFFISGKVQGVYFRQSAVDEATRLGLNGFAKNLSDGRVEIIASGETAALTEFVEWLQQGPPMAEVDQIEQRVIDVVLPEGFTVRF